MSVKKLKIIFILSALCLGAGLLSAYKAPKLYAQRQTRLMMDTYVTISVVGYKGDASGAINLALERMQEINVKFNALNPQSPIYAFNHQGQPVSDAEVLGLIRVALEVSRASQGAFDITVAPLVELWGFYEKSLRLPSEQEIKGCLSNIGYQHLLFNNGELRKDSEGIKIDLGGIAKGYALKEAIKVLKGQGITSALIDLGGDVYALGRKGRKPWKVGIRNPRGEGILGFLEVTDASVMSSGDYERFFIRGDKRYHHIFNPKNGYPTEGVTAVTLVYADPVFAQAWAKVPFILGPQQGLEILKNIPGMEVVIVTSSGEVLCSPQLKYTRRGIFKKDKRVRR